MSKIVLLLILSVLPNILAYYHNIPSIQLSRKIHDKTILKPNVFQMKTGRQVSKLWSSLNVDEKLPPLNKSISILGYSIPFKDIPNQLTIARIFAIPIFILGFLLQKRYWVVWSFVFASVTDFVDGYLARKWNLTSAFGAFLDPVADKLMVSTALIFLVCQIPVLWIALPVAITILREITISALREWMAERSLRNVVKVGSIGKAKTALQMISITLLLISSPGFGNQLGAVGLSRSILFSWGVLTLYLSTLLTVISGVQYMMAAWPSITADA